MSSNHRQASSSPGERQRTTSRSSSRSRRTPSSTAVHQTDAHHNKTSPKASKKHPQETKRTGRPRSNASNKEKSKAKKSPSPTRKGYPKRKKPVVPTSDADNVQAPPPNDDERQDLSSRGLSVAPGDIFDLVSLRRLVLSNNNLAGLPPNIRALVNLEYLDLSRNPLRVKNGSDDYSCLPREFRYLRNLQTLIMAECTLKHIPVAIWSITSLQTLDISRNKVGYIVGEIGNLTDIRHLRLSQMDLDTLPAEIGFCDQLETMDLSGNPIDNLPETLVECRHLHELKISYKTFYKLLDNYMLQLLDEGKIRSEHIPHVIFELENLQILDLNQTKLNSLPLDHTLLNLNELYLSNNSFFNIPEAICTMEQLRILDMSHNRLENIPDYFIRIQRLETLILSYNNLTTLPSIITRVSTLTKLIVSHNRIHTIEDGISQSQSLLILNLSYNNLKSIPNDLCHLKQLETLDLRYNQLEYLPLAMPQLTGLKSMNTFDEDYQRMGLHLLGNAIIDPPSYIWKSTLIQTLFEYIETKDKALSNQFFHLKLILIGPKHTGKTTLIAQLLTNQKLIANKRKTLDMYTSVLPENHSNIDEQNALQGDTTSSILTDQWIENRISTSGEYFLSRSSKVTRIAPPSIGTYRSNEVIENFMNKSTIITKNNLSCTILDITSEPSFELLYPLIYDSNALFILPVNLTVLMNIIQAAVSFENQPSTMIDYNQLLTDEWLYYHLFRYIESIADHCQQASIAIVGLILNNEQKQPIDDQQQELLDEIHSRINMFVTNEEYQRKNVKLYSEFFPEPIHLDDEKMSGQVVEILQIIAQQWNIKHHKHKRQVLKQRLGFTGQDASTIDYETCLKRFEQPISSSPNEDEEHHESLENEINQMNLDECLTYLTLTGDIICFGCTSQSIILLKAHDLLNSILSRTIFRPRIEQWLNYDDNLLFRFSGYYRTEDSFNLDRESLLTRGEYTWKMLTVLFFAQNNDNHTVLEPTIVDYCRLMERLQLGYVVESNSDHREFTTLYFVCPWLSKAKSPKINAFDYFKSLEQKRSQENLYREQIRRIKQQQLWFAMDNEQEKIPQDLLEIPSIEEFPLIEIPDSQVINQDAIITIQIRNEDSNFLPNGLCERLLICLHPLIYERVDYANITFGRTWEKNFLQIERSDDENSISITMNHCLLESIETLLQHLFSFYPMINLRIET